MRRDRRAHFTEAVHHLHQVFGNSGVDARARELGAALRRVLLTA